MKYCLALLIIIINTVTLNQDDVGCEGFSGMKYDKKSARKCKDKCCLQNASTSTDFDLICSYKRSVIATSLCVQVSLLIWSHAHVREDLNCAPAHVPHK